MKRCYYHTEKNYKAEFSMFDGEEEQGGSGSVLPSCVVSEASLQDVMNYASHSPMRLVVKFRVDSRVIQKLYRN